MLQRCLLLTSALVAVAVLGLSALPSARAEEDPKKVPHLQISLYELREAKEDVRDVVGIPEKERTEILGGIDAAIDNLKKTIVACGGKPDYIKPAKRPKYSNFKHLRHSIKELKEAKEQLKTETVPEEAKVLVEKGKLEIDKCVRHLERALDYIK